MNEKELVEVAIKSGFGALANGDGPLSKVIPPSLFVGVLQAVADRQKQKDALIVRAHLLGVDQIEVRDFAEMAAKAIETP